jgi:glycerol-3-phosphate O-acyltransferase
MNAPETQPSQPQGWLTRLKNWFGNTFSGRDYHYYGYLPSRPNFLLRHTLDRFFARVNVSPHQLEDVRQLAEKGIVVYALKYRSHLDFLFFNRRYRQSGAPPPEFAFDLNLWIWQPLSHLIQIISASINYFTKKRQWPNPYADDYFRWILNKRTSGLLFLVDEVGFRQRFYQPKEDPIRHLLEIQKDQPLPIFLVPQMVMEKDPPREDKGLLQLFFGDSENPGRLRKLALFFFRSTKAVVQVAEPLNLQDVIADQANEKYLLEDVAKNVRRELINRIDRTRRVTTGPVIKSMEEFMELTLTDPDLTNFMEHMAEVENQKIAKIKKKAQSYFLEIASDYNALIVHLADKTLHWVWQNIFEGISLDEAGIERIRRASPLGTLIYVPCHKSHIDYLMLNYIVYRHNLHPPRVAAGKNLSFWPVGTIFRKVGAFFIRRRFHGAKLYAEVFATYLKTLIKEGFNIEFFIEGGRSRTGKLVLPQLGLLNMILRAYQEGVTPDLIFVPSFIGYDQVMEEKAYLTELKGTQKKAESWRQLFHIRKLLKKRYGRVYLRFSEPIFYSEYLRRHKLDNRQLSDEERRVVCRDLAFSIIQNINNVSVVTPFSLVCAALLTYPRKGVYRQELLEIINVFHEYLVNRQANLSETLMHLPQTLEEALNLCSARKLITPIEKEEELADELGLGAYSIDEGKRLVLEYYKDNIIHFFIPASMVAMSILSTQTPEFNGKQILADYRFLKDLFKYEFVYDDLGSEANVARMLKYFSNRGVIGIIDREADTYLLSASGLKELSYFANLLHNYLESYWITLRSIKFLKNRPRNERDFLKRIQSIGSKLHKVGEVERAEALSDANFTNALKLFGEKGVILKKAKAGKKPTTFSRPEDEDTREFYGQQLARFLRR